MISNVNGHYAPILLLNSGASEKKSVKSQQTVIK